MKPLLVLALVAAGRPAVADGLVDLGSELTPRRFASPRDRTEVDLAGALRLRGEAMWNLDLDRGLTPSGQALFPVPLADPGGQLLRGADMRLRTDLAIYPRGAGVAIKGRFDILDDVGLGSTPEGKPASGRAPSPAASPGQRSPAQAVQVERVWGEVLTPFGLLAGGRMGAHWGLGMLAHGGDCDDCDGGDAADRVAFVTPIAGHLWAVAYDFTATGPYGRRRDQVRSVDLEPTDDVHTATFAVMAPRTELARLRRREAGLPTFEYGAYLSHRWQRNDVPADWLPVAQPAPIDAGQVMARGYAATATDLWLRLQLPRVRVEAEVAYLHARVDQPSLIPGVLLDRPVTSDQFGVAMESEWEHSGGRAAAGLDLGYASGDPAPGFGAFPDPGAAAPLPGDVDGPQASLPRDASVDNFRFHPDYRIDRILFREIIGTVTDAIYLRPHGRWRLVDDRHAQLDAELAVIWSWAAQAVSTPSGGRPLGLELDPGLTYRTRDGFGAALEYAVLIPGSGLDNPGAGLSARPAQLWRLRLGYHFR